MLEAVAIFLLILAGLCGLVTYISAHNNPLKIPDLTKPGSIATVGLFVAAIVTALWTPVGVYGDCSTLAEDALAARGELLTFELQDVGGKTESLVIKSSDRIINYFEENESCFLVPEERSALRVEFKVSDEQLSDEEAVIAANWFRDTLADLSADDKINVLSNVKAVSPKSNADQAAQGIPPAKPKDWGPAITMYKAEDLWSKETDEDGNSVLGLTDTEMLEKWGSYLPKELDDSKKETGNIDWKYSGEDEAKALDCRSTSRAKRRSWRGQSEFMKECEKKVEWTKRIDAEIAKALQVTEWVHKGHVAISDWKPMLNENGINNCDAEDLKKAGQVNINQKNFAM